MDTSLLPITSGLFEKALEEALNPRWQSLEAAVEAIRKAKHIDRPPSYLPWLVYEYGLGPLTPYVPNVYQLIDEGVRWQRVRGTAKAYRMGLGWIGYSADIEEAWHGRNWWNSYQLRFPDLPAQDSPDLERIEGISILSGPLRSDLRRGVHQYDVGPLIADYCRLDDSMLERESGIAVTPAGTLWSFGRTTEIRHMLTEAEGLAIGNWLEPVDTGSSAWMPISLPDAGFGVGTVPDLSMDPGLPWVEAHYLWNDADILWSSIGTSARSATMAAWFVGRSMFLTFRDAGGQVIGHRRCRAVRPVIERYSGLYSFAGSSYQPTSTGTALYVEAMTDFGDAADVVASSVELNVGGDLADGIPPGRLWLASDDLSGGAAIAVSPVSIPLRTTVRECVKFLVRF
ncbi:phage tail protein [Rhizobium sp. S95]|uniref:Phage tail protein n=1 Tax=Ciceribacter sichuanensis TaxID=2949647 RepID=A0AAJ1BZ67_9HYPH|nr:MULTISPECIES: phage tail protein [unclassified Ciceribacter]MCM2396186.1 phage tail protein [Ciceribacter sp. S95]MCO5957663.1 phage tail protein [Ciceribacter sp. S101]